jgi:hypothetical protein
VTPWPKALARYVKRFKARTPIRRSRLLYDLPTHARLALSGSEPHARVLVHCWQQAQESGKAAHPCVTAYLRAARRRYSRDKDKDRSKAVARALGFMVGKGRPPISADKNQMAVDIVLQRGRQRWDDAVADAAILLRMSERQVKSALSKARRS